MARQKLNQLKQLLAMKERESQKAMQAWQDVQTQFSSLRQRHQQLQQYREEYITQLHSLGEKGCRLSQMKNRLDFITQLENAQQQLGHQLAKMAKQRQQAQQKLQEARIAEESIKKLIERHLAEIQHHLNRTEQKENDEFARNQCYSRPISANNTTDRD